jgi:hypothetical protein
MYRLTTIFICCLPFFASCKENKENNKFSATTTVLRDSVYSICTNSGNDTVVFIGTKGRFTVDDFPIPFNLLRTNYSKKKIDDFFIVDQAWFVNDTIKQVLVISIATDLHRMQLFSFSYDEFSPIFLNEIAIYKSNQGISDLIENPRKQSLIPLFIDSARKAPVIYFKTHKGFSLGDCKEKAIKVYGNPHTAVTVNSIEKLTWEYDGDGEDPNFKVADNKLIANNSFGNTVVMYFRNNRLIGLSLFNEIP